MSNSHDPDPDRPRTALLSVVVPCFNDGRYLERSVGSICRQLLPGEEVIIVDDGSTDDTPFIIQKLIQRFDDKEIRVIRQRNAGVSSARNTGAAAALGDYLVFLDADDELATLALPMYRSSIAREHPLWIIGGTEWQSSRKTQRASPEISTDPKTNFAAFIAKELHVGNVSCMCFRRDVHQHFAFPENLKVGEDYVFLALLFAHMVPTVLNETTSIVHRRQSGSLRSSSSWSEMAASELVTTLFSDPSLPPTFRQFENMANNRHWRSLLRFAWKKRLMREYVVTYKAALRTDPLLILRLKWSWRYLCAWTLCRPFNASTWSSVKLPLETDGRHER